MKTFRFLPALFLFCFTLAGCRLAATPTATPPPLTATASATPPPARPTEIPQKTPSGKLIYLSGNALHELDFASGKSQTLQAASQYLQASGTGQYLHLDPTGKTLLFNGYDALFGCSTWRPVYVCEEAGPNGFFTYDLTNSAVNLIRPYTISDITLSPDGQNLAFTVLEFDTPDYQVHLKISSVAGGEPQILSSGHVVDSNPSWSPDGKWIAFLRVNSPDPKAPQCTQEPGPYDTCTNPLPSLYIIHPDDSGLKKLLNQVRLLNSPYNQPVWSPDGSTLSLLSGEPQAQLTLVSLADGTVHLVEGFQAVGGIPAWSPDGRTVAFTAVIKNENQIVLYDVETQTPSVLTGGANPVWSPDGEWLAYIHSSQSGQNSLVLISKDGQQSIDPGLAGVGTIPLWVK